MSIDVEGRVPIYQANYGGVPADFLVSGSSFGDYCYYRMPNGWIGVGPVGKRNVDKHRYTDQGWTALDSEYGLIDFLKEYYTNNPFEVLFLRGGAHELPVAQVKALGYDRHPPILPRCGLMIGQEHSRPTGRPLHFARCWTNTRVAEFPQLAGLELIEVEPCDFCERNDFATKQGRDQHTRVMHLDEMREITTAREMARGMRDAVVTGVSGISARLAGAGFPVGGLSARPFGCGLCGETFEKTRGREGLEEHLKLHEGEGDDPAEGD